MDGDGWDGEETYEVGGNGGNDAEDQVFRDTPGGGAGSTSVRTVLYTGEVDYSFSELPTLEDILDEKPRKGRSQAEIEAIRIRRDELEADPPPPVDTFDINFRPIETPKATSVPTPRKITAILKLNNNALANISGFESIAPKILLHPSELRTLDLSMNALTTIWSGIPKAFPNLQVLRLHGNEITKQSSVDVLSQLPRLISLTLHGNEVEHTPGYRNYVISALPGLKSLDFTSITNKARTDAVIWRKIHGPKKTRAQFQ